MDNKAFADMLISDGVLARDQVRRVATAMKVGGVRIDTALLELGLVSEPTLLAALARFHRIRPATAAELAAAGPDLARLISPRVAKRYEVVPFRLEGKKLSVASLNPGDLLAEDEIALLTGCLVSTCAALEVRVYEALSRLYQVEMTPLIESVTARLRAGTSDRAAPPASLPSPVVPVETPVGPVLLTPVTEVAPEEEHTEPAEEHLEPEGALPPIDEAASQAAEPPTVSPAPPVRPSARRRTEVSELEISDEELELFPSLRQTGDVGDTESAQLRPQTPTTEPEPPPAAEVSEPEAQAAPSPFAEPTMAAPEHEPALAITETDPEVRLAVASAELVDAEMREEIADSLLAFCAPYLRRRLLLIVRKDNVVGWRGEGQAVDGMAVRAISIPASAPSVFFGLLQGSSFWLGSLPPMPRNVDLVLGLGGDEPKECVILPVVVKSKTVCFLYGDNCGEPLGGLPMSQLRRLVAKAGVAFQVYILKSKIRTI